MSASSEQMLTELMNTGHEALERGDWQAAYDSFSTALRHEETPEILEGLGLAAWWLHDGPTVFETRERAYRRYRERDDQQGAARVAICLALDYYLFRGEHAVVNGWFQLARRLLDGLDLCPEHAIINIWQGYVALMADNDVATARELSRQAAEFARSLDQIDYEMLAQALYGFALVSSGELDEGMRLLDEATTTAMAGDMTDLDAIVTTCCFLIYACERVRDYDRAVQWCVRASEIAERWNYRFMFSFCKVHHASVLVWRGEWHAAEAELTAATDDLMATHPAVAGEGMTRLAELRRRQGRLDEAADLLRRAETHPMRMASGNYALLGRASLELDRGNPETAADLAERFLRHIQNEDRLERVAGLEVLIRAQAALGQHDHARETLESLRSTSDNISTPPLRAALSHSEGVVCAAAGDLDAARRRFEDAADLFNSSGAPYETALAKLELAAVLASSGREDAATYNAAAALETFQHIGASREVKRATTLLRQLADAGQRGSVSLTPREIEVLRLVAEGLTDKELALSLSLSEHTVHRHIANILSKLDLPSRTAAVAHAARSGLI